MKYWYSTGTSTPSSSSTTNNNYATITTTTTTTATTITTTTTTTITTTTTTTSRLPPLGPTLYLKWNINSPRRRPVTVVMLMWRLLPGPSRRGLKWPSLRGATC